MFAWKAKNKKVGRAFEIKGPSIQVAEEASQIIF